MQINERDTREERLARVAEEMMTAARTAPKAKGIDIIDVLAITGATIAGLSEAMLEYSARTGLKFIARDAENILQAGAIVLVGTRAQVQGLDCGYCGFPTCEAKGGAPDVPCAINTVDVGIAIGSACALAAGSWYLPAVAVPLIAWRAGVARGGLSQNSVWGRPIAHSLMWWTWPRRRYGFPGFWHWR